MKKLKEIFKNKQLKETTWSLLSKSITLVLFLLINIFLARKLGVESFGLWSLYLSIMTILFSLSYFGINNSSGKFIAQYNYTDNLKGVLLSSLKLRLIFSLIFTILLIIFYKNLATIFNNKELESLLFYGIPLIFLSGIVEYLKSVFIGLHRIKYNFIINLSEYGLKLFLIFLFLMFSANIITVINSFILSLFITSLIGGYLLYFNFYKNLKSTNINFTSQILSYSYPIVFITLGFIALTEIDTVMIGYFLGGSEVGIYAVAKQIIIKLPHLSVALSMGIMPIFAKLNEENKLQLKKKFFNLFKIVLVIYGMTSVAILFISPLLIPFIFGTEYTKSVLPLQILIVYLFCFSASIIMSSFLDYTGKAKKRAYNISFTMVLNILLNLTLIPKFGATGAALATSISYLPYVVLNWIEVKKSLT